MTNYFLFPHSSKNVYVFHTDPQQPGLSNALQPAREAGKAAAAWGTMGCREHGDRLRAPGKGNAKGVPTAAHPEWGEQLEPDLLLALGGDLQLLGKPAAQGQDKWRWTSEDPQN